MKEQMSGCGTVSIYVCHEYMCIVTWVRPKSFKIGVHGHAGPNIMRECRKWYAQV